MTPESSAYHTPALLTETLDLLAPQPGETFLDATLGGGGHSVALAAKLQPGGTLIGLDRDADALAAAGERLGPFRNVVDIILLRSPFGKLTDALDANSTMQGRQLDGVLFDLGVSSHQLDTDRGFSFRRDEPLDMRMSRDEDALPTAADLLATETEFEIARFIFEYGEERFSRRIAKQIVERRTSGDPIRTTAQLAALVEKAIPRSVWPRDIHPATRTFQGLRIAVNDELGQLQMGLEAAVNRLAPGGRIAVISYHSLEDRIVKQAFANWAGRSPSAPGSSPRAFLEADTPALLTLLTRKPVVATDAENARNPRARSAKLRAAQRNP